MMSGDAVRSVRTRLGPVGAWLAILMSAPVSDERHLAHRIEELGYGSIWTGELIGGKEAFAHQSVLLASTERIVTGTGIANVWARHPATMQGGAATLGAAYPGRFILGVGISHGPVVTRSGQSYEKPLSRMAEYLEGMDAAAGEGGDSETAVPRVLAALRPQMLALARDRADGAHPYLVPPSHTTMAREILGTDKLLIPEQAVVLHTSPDEARRIAREHLRIYLQVPNYVNSLKHLGYTSEDISDGGSDRLVDAIVAWGSEEDIVNRVREHRDGGADHVLLQPLGNLQDVTAQLERLSPALLAY